MPKGVPARMAQARRRGGPARRPQPSSKSSSESPTDKASDKASSSSSPSKKRSSSSSSAKSASPPKKPRAQASAPNAKASATQSDSPAPEQARPPTKSSKASDDKKNDDSEDKQLLAARSLIEKYKLPGGKQFLAPSLVGFDTANRDGIPLNGDRCDVLLHEIETMGWDPEEANFGNLCVEERPGKSTLLQYNRRACADHKFLADIKVDRLQFGTLSHSHLHQCLKNIAAGTPAERPTSFILNGRLSLDAVASVQPLLADSVRRGLEWTILSWRIREEPGALELIQAAWNRKSSISMKETEVQAVARLSQICSSLADGDNKIDYNLAKAKLRQSMPHYADSSDFLGLLRFVVTLGAQGARWIDDLKTFVGMRGQNRHVKAATFALVGTLPPSAPHLITGFLRGNRFPNQIGFAQRNTTPNNSLAMQGLSGRRRCFFAVC
jgi:hypothetical protein